MTVPTMPARWPDLLLPPLRSRARWVLAVAACVAAPAHIPVIGSHLEEAPYMGALFIVLTTACLLLAATAIGALVTARRRQPALTS